jgi:transposase
MSDSGWRGVYRVRPKKKKNWRCEEEEDAWCKEPELKSEELWRRRSLNECKEEEEGRVRRRRVRNGKRKLERKGRSRKGV